jgi:hypothetical protein
VTNLLLPLLWKPKLMKGIFQLFYSEVAQLLLQMKQYYYLRITIELSTLAVLTILHPKSERPPDYD